MIPMNIIEYVVHGAIVGEKILVVTFW